MLVTTFSLLLSILIQNYVNYSMLPRVSTTFHSFNELKITKMIIWESSLGSVVTVCTKMFQDSWFDNSKRNSCPDTQCVGPTTN